MIRSVKRLIQIVPKLPPSIDGLGDYALNLARELRKRHGVETSFVVGNSDWRGASEINGFTIQKLDFGNGCNLSSFLFSRNGGRQADNTVLLHYVGYGYAKRGCPIGLARNLRQWKAKASGARLVAVFHEIYAFGPPWRSSFWLSPLQKKLAGEIAILSDDILTNRQNYAKSLRLLGFSKKIQVLPVISTIGEPESVSPLSQRLPRLIVFGHDRRRIYRRSIPKLAQVCELLGIQEIYDIGPSLGFKLSKIHGIPVLQLGKMAPHEISRLMTESYAGYFEHDTNFLAKSSIFAAYGAHGMVPVTGGRYRGDEDGLQRGQHYLMIDRENKVLKSQDLQPIADNAWKWYDNHKLSIQADIFNSYL